MRRFERPLDRTMMVAVFSAAGQMIAHIHMIALVPAVASLLIPDLEDHRKKEPRVELAAPNEEFLSRVVHHAYCPLLAAVS